MRSLLSVQTLFVLTLVAVGGWFGVREFQERLIYIKETDARIATDLVTISSRAEGWLTELHVEEGQAVEADTPIAALDDRAVRLEMDKLRAQLDGVAAERARLGAERRMVEAQTDTLLATRASRVRAADAIMRALQPQLELARTELRRADSLSRDGVVSRQQYDEVLTSVHRLEGDYLSAQARHAEAEGELAEAGASRARLEVLARETDKLQHHERELAGELARLQLELDDRLVRSPLHGVVDRMFVERGEFVRAGQRIALVHDPRRIWIEANVKETELRRLELAQPVRIRVDAFPDVRVSGRVARIGQSTTATFALLPNPNPSGNFTKITQRVPVRIDLDEADARLRPGLMVEVQIDIR